LIVDLIREVITNRRCWGVAPAVLAGAGSGAV
jgi:hypothetical protein